MFGLQSHFFRFLSSGTFQKCRLQTLIKPNFLKRSLDFGWKSWQLVSQVLYVVLSFGSCNSAVAASGNYLTQVFHDNVTSCEYAWNGSMHVFVGNDVSIFHLEFALEQLGFRIETYEYEDTKCSVFLISLNLSGLAGFGVFYDHRCNNAVAFDLFDCGVPHECHLWISKCFFLDGFSSSELVTSVNQSYFSCELGEVHSFFNSRVAAAYYVYFKIFEEVCITGCAVRNTFTGEFFLTWAANRTRGCTGSDNNSFCIVIAMVAFQVFYLSLRHIYEPTRRSYIAIAVLGCL